MSQPDPQNPQINWFAIHTRSKCESVVKRELFRVGETYLPMQWVRRKWSDRIKQIHVPLIPCYLFIQTLAENKAKILQNRNVISIPNIKGKIIPIPEKDIELVKRIEEYKGSFNYVEEGYQYRNGEKIEFTNGPLFGQIGFLINHLNQNYVTVQVPSLKWWFKANIKDIAPHYSQLNSSTPH